MRKHSKQRDSIKRFLTGRTDHPTAETVYLNIKDEIPNISLATVYRNLSLLADLGEIQRLHTGNGPDRFDANISPHNHFMCRKCGNVLDLKMDTIRKIRNMDGSDFQGSVEAHQTFFYGLCPDCLAQEENTESAEGA